MEILVAIGKYVTRFSCGGTSITVPSERGIKLADELRGVAQDGYGFLPGLHGYILSEEDAGKFIDRIVDGRPNDQNDA